MHRLFCGLLAMVTAAVAGPALAASEREWPTASIEIFKLAPGMQEPFLRDIARYDEVLAAGGQPPLKIFIHQEGADWDVIIYKQSGDFDPTAEQQAAMDARKAELNIPEGPAYFHMVREWIAAHEDSRAIGPISAGEWLAELDRWRDEHGGAAD